MEKFSPTTLEHIGYYVYALADPKDGKIFYIGKGHENRVFAHARAALASNEITTSDKLNTIREIRNRGEEVQTLILRHGLKEHEAFIVESVLIDLFTNSLVNLQVNANITNQQGGHDMRELGIRSVEEVEAQYGSEPMEKVSDPLIIININKTYHSKSKQAKKDASDNIYEATRQSWRLCKRRADKAKYILSEYRGVIRAIFEMDEKKWQPIAVDGKKYPRYFFTGSEVTDSIVLSMYKNKRINKNQGASNPIQYRNL